MGYVGSRSALEVTLDGLRRLEYRGYDSAGVAVVEPDGLRVERRAGKLKNLADALAQDLRGEGGPWRGTTGMGHTRWATHGGPTDANAHPHVDCTGTIAVIHNGIIENFAQLRSDLEARGHAFGSDTDTEVVAHLLEERLGSVDDPAQPSIADALRDVCRQLSGAFTLVVTSADEPGLVVAARRNSPLVVGLGAGETFLASDVVAFIAHTRDALEIGQDQVVELRADGVTVTDFAGLPTAGKPFHVDWGCERRGEGWPSVLHAQGDPRAAAGAGRHPCAADCRPPARSSSTSCGWIRKSCATSTRSSSSRAARPTTPE